MADVERNQVPLSSLVLDEKLMPRDVDSMHLRQLTDALEMGRELPPIIADAASRRVVDGRHRYEATRRIRGADGLISVIFKDYASEQEMWEEAVAANAQHGKPYTSWEQRNIYVAGKERGLSLERISDLLQVPAASLERRTAVGYSIVRSGPAATIQRRPVALKRPLAHLAGRTLTPQELKANAHNSGHRPRFHAQQLVDWIDSGTLDYYLDDRRTVTELMRLRRKLNGLTLPDEEQPQPR